MSTAGRHTREDSQAVIVLDSDDETPAFKQSEAGPSARQGATAAPRLAGTKRSRNADAPRLRSLNRYVSTDEDVVDLTTALSTAPVSVPSSAQSNDDICIVGSDTSPAAKRRNIAVAKALAAHRKLGQQIVAHAHHGSEPKEVETKPKCGICLDEMKEPACGSCGHVFCKPCLLSCLKATKKCPTCRKTLQPRTVHRIYLS
ncbi:TPA: hypothetical protein ACH3X1_003937 [Trebouxia sp. C0004]